MAVILLTAWVVVVIIVMILYTTRHFIFTFSRLFSKQRVSFGDAYEDDLPHVTVLVPMHNEETVAEDCLRAILASDYPVDRLHVVPINDHSEDRTQEIVDAYAARDSRVRPLNLEGRSTRGKSNALNFALENVESEIVLVFDADYTPGIGLVRRLVMAFIDPEVGAVMGRVVPRNTNRSLLTRLLSMERSGGYQVDQQARFNLDLLPQYGGTVGGFRLALLRQIGGFDPHGLSEDTELTASIYEHGWTILYDNRAECYEEVPESWLSRFNQLRRWSRGHNRVMWGHLFRVAFAKNLSGVQRADAAFLLFCYVVPPLLISGWIAEFVLFAMGQLPALGGILLAFMVVIYNSFGNFAPVYEVATAEILDGHTTRLYLLPFLFYSFPFNSWTITTGFIDNVGDRIKSRVGDWDKTTRAGTDQKANGQAANGQAPADEKPERPVKPAPKAVSPALKTVGLLIVAAALAGGFFYLFYTNGANAESDRMLAAVTTLGICAAFAIFVLLPMLPGFLEVQRERDAQSLNIDQSYSRDPRYMGKSFREKISSVLASAPMHTRMPFLSRQKEFARIVPSLEVGDDESWTDAVLSKGTVTSGLRASLVDLYAQGDVRIGAGSKLRAVAADGDVQLGSNVFLSRWIDAEKDIRVGPNSNLGHSVTAVGTIGLARNVQFGRLCGNPIVVGDAPVAHNGPLAPATWLSSPKRRITVAKDTVAAGETVNSDMISRGEIELQDGAAVKGSVKADGDVVVGPNATIYGNVVARGDVTIRAGGSIRGHVFAEGNVIMAKGSTVGAPGAAKTLYSSRDIQLADGACVYGWVICEGRGLTVATATTA